MTKQNRSTLINYFHVGAMPTTEHFTDLIDSSLNILDQGFDKTAEQGFNISALSKEPNLVTFSRDSTPSKGLWTISFDQDVDSLLFKKTLDEKQVNHKEGRNKASAVLSMTQQGFVGINNSKPEQSLDISGVLKSDGRIGSQLGIDKNIPADGSWHNISPKLDGCQLLEINAGVGIKRSGRYALIHAHALNTCNPTGFWFNLFNFKNPIKCQHAYYNSPADKLKLRWVTAETDENTNPAYRPYYLQIRSNTDYGEGIFIRYHITQLWLDAYMQDSQLTNDEPQ